MGKLYSSEIWQEWCLLESNNYRIAEDSKRKVYVKKGYLHFDNRFWFPDNREEIDRVVNSQKNFACWAFYPFLKHVIKTHRFKKDKQSGLVERKVKERPICYAAHKDALIYGFFSFSLNKQYEEYIHRHGFSDVVYAYRTDLEGSCNIQFAKEVFNYINEIGECTAIALDITGFFDNLCHDILKEKWIKVIGEERLPAEHYKLYKTLTQFAFANTSDLLDYLNVDLSKIKPFPRSLLDLFPEKKYAELFRQLRKRGIIQIQKEKGIPQGAPMSAVLSNIYMIDFDDQLSKLANERHFLYRRYCDDILIVCSNELAIEIKERVYELIDDCRLIIQQEKEEEIVFKIDSSKKIRAFNAKEILKRNHRFVAGKEHYFYKPLQYLGFEFNGQDILIRNSSICRYHKKLRRRINKSVKMAYSENGVADKVFSKTTYYRYSHLGKRNFISYVYKASSKNYENSNGEIKIGMNSPKIKRQVMRHMKQIKKLLAQKNTKRFEHKITKGKKVTLKNT